MKRPTGFSNEQLTWFYRQMVMIRIFEEEVLRCVKAGLFHGTTHLCIGQEATAVGACAVLRPDDKMTSTHRGHGHSIAKGANIDKMMAEMFGKVTGYCKGKGGSMHIADVDAGNLGSNGVVAGGIPIAVGSALRSQLTGSDDVTICFFGDGATNEGAFHEAVNLAAIWQLPVIFFCENNQYGMSSPIREMANVQDLSKRAVAYGIPGMTIDGNDLVEVLTVMQDVEQHVRAGKGPVMIEAKTYRYNGHSKSDRELYRTRAEIEAWKEKDPIPRFEAMLRQWDVLKDVQMDEIKLATQQLVKASTVFAKESVEPALEELFTDVYA
jgi:pyruvate dehydrogenase E1 component alpha subunit